MPEATQHMNMECSPGESPWPVDNSATFHPKEELVHWEALPCPPLSYPLLDPHLRHHNRAEIMNPSKQKKAKKGAGPTPQAS